MLRSNYVYGFNGKEMDNDMSGGKTGATYDYGFRIYDSRIAKFLSVDPLTRSYPWFTPYSFAGNKPIVNIDLDGLEEHNYLNELLKKGTGMIVRKAWDVASNAIYNVSITLLKEAKEYTTNKIMETPYVQDISITPSESVISVGGASVNIIITGGVSWSNTLSDNKAREGIYPHIGIGFNVSAGAADKYNFPALSYSLGIIGGKYNTSKDYAGLFLDYSGTFCGIGADYCYYPGGSNATSLTFNLTDFVKACAAESPNGSGSFRIDWYFMIPDKNDPETSWANQFKNFKKEFSKMFDGAKEDYNLINKELDKMFDKIIQESESKDE